MRRISIVAAALLAGGVVLLPLLPTSVSTPLTTCACVQERYAWFNPFRDREPERVAIAFASDEGKYCGTIARDHIPGLNAACLHHEQSSGEDRVQRWTVINRAPDPTVYGFERIALKGEPSGLAIVWLGRDHNGWGVESYWRP